MWAIPTSVSAATLVPSLWNNQFQSRPLVGRDFFCVFVDKREKSVYLEHSHMTDGSGSDHREYGVDRADRLGKEILPEESAVFISADLWVEP